MINTIGAYILIIIVSHYGAYGTGIGVTSERLDNFDACKAAQVQLQAAGINQTYCVAAEVIK